MSLHVGISADVRARVEASQNDPFDVYHPPFDLVSDMLFATASAPVEPLRAAFPDVPFASAMGRALLAVWFTRVLEIRFGRKGRNDVGTRISSDDLPYQELNVAVLLHGRSVFVPGIYATSDLTLELGHRYGMPKAHARMEYGTDGSSVVSRAVVNGDETRVRAHVPTVGRPLGALVASTLPWWSWPLHFPGGSWIEGYVRSADGARAAWVREGRLALNVPWLPHAVALWRPALHIPRQRMTLPDPHATTAP